jgi:WD40 repeat protein
VAATGHAYATEVRELSTGRTLFNVPTANSRWILFTPDSAHLIDATPGTQVRCQEVATGQVVGTHELPVRSLAGAVSPDGKWVACGLNANEIQILSIPDLHPLRVLKTDTGRVNSLAVSPDGRRLLFGGPFGSIHVYDTADWRELVVLSQREHPSSRGYDGLELLSISANGETLIGYRADGFVRAWDCRPNQN